MLGEDVEPFFLTKYCFYNKLYLQRAARGHQYGKRGKDSFMTFYGND